VYWGTEHPLYCHKKYRGYSDNPLQSIRVGMKVLPIWIDGSTLIKNKKREVICKKRTY
jgi:hypothetical protein